MEVPFITYNGDLVYIRWDEGSPVFVVTPDGEITTQYREPSHGDELLTPDAAIRWVLGRLSQVRMSKAVRNSIAHALDIDWDW